MTIENTIQDEAPESYSSEDLAVQQADPSTVQQAPGPDVESPPSTSDAPLPGASTPDPRIEEAERALSEERGKLAELQRSNEEFQRANEETQFNSQVEAEVQKRQNDLISQNWGEVEAKQEARSYGRAVIAEKQVTNLGRQLEDAGRLVRAMQLEKETGTPAADLIPYNTPAEMERAARSRSTDNKRINDLEAEIVKMKQGAVPAGQSYDSNSGSGGMSDDQLIAAYANGETVDVSKVQEALGRLN